MRLWKPEGGHNGEWRMVEFEDGAMLEAMEEERLWSIRERAQLEAGREEEEPVLRFCGGKRKCMYRGVAVASRGSESSRISSRAVEARLDVPAANFDREGEDINTTTYLLSYYFI